MPLTQIHARLAISALMFVVILTLWGFWRYFRKQGLDGNYWGALATLEVLILAQGALGIFLWYSGLRPGHGGMHVLYGIVSAITLPAAYAFTKGRDARREMLIYSLALIFLAGVAARAMLTGN